MVMDCLHRSVEEMEAWKNHFKLLTNVSEEGRTEMASKGIQIGVGRLHSQGEVERSVVKGIMKMLKIGKTLGTDGMKAEILKGEGEAVLEWIY